MHDGEDALLHFSCVLGTKDDHLHPLEVDLDGRGGAHALGESVGGELSGIVNDEIGFTEVAEFFIGRSDQHVVLRSTFSVEVAEKESQAKCRRTMKSA